MPVAASFIIAYVCTCLQKKLALIIAVKGLPGGKLAPAQATVRERPKISKYRGFGSSITYAAARCVCHSS